MIHVFDILLFSDALLEYDNGPCHIKCIIFIIGQVCKEVEFVGNTDKGKETSFCTVLCICL